MDKTTPVREKSMEQDAEKMTDKNIGLHPRENTSPISLGENQDENKNVIGVKRSSEDVLESDHTDTDYGLEAAVRHACTHVLPAPLPHVVDSKHRDGSKYIQQNCEKSLPKPALHQREKSTDQDAEKTSDKNIGLQTRKHISPVPLPRALNINNRDDNKNAIGVKRSSEDVLESDHDYGLKSAVRHTHTHLSPVSLWHVANSKNRDGNKDILRNYEKSIPKPVSHEKVELESVVRHVHTHLSPIYLTRVANDNNQNGNNTIPRNCEKSPFKPVHCEKVEDVIGAKRSSEEVVESDSDHTDTDYGLETAVRCASKKKKKHRPLFKDLVAPTIFAHLSLSVREITNNVELIRLPMVGRTRESLQSHIREEMWPGVACGGAAIQCIHCCEAARHVLPSLSNLWQHLGLLAYYHFSKCTKIPSAEWIRLQALIPRFSADNFHSFQTELGLLCQHVSDALRLNSEMHVALVQTHPQNSLTRCRGRGRSEAGVRVTDLEQLAYQRGLNGTTHVTAKKILGSASTTYKPASFDYNLGCEAVMLNNNHKISKEKRCGQVSHATVSNKGPYTGASVRKGQSLVMHLEEMAHYQNKNGYTSYACRAINNKNNYI